MNRLTVFSAERSVLMDITVVKRGAWTSKHIHTFFLWCAAGEQDNISSKLHCTRDGQLKARVYTVSTFGQ